jgi:hypothetical protein
MENIGTQLTDFEIALGLANHIEDPCSVLVNGRTYNIRDFYLRLAKDVTPKLVNGCAKEFLESIIKKYE